MQENKEKPFTGSIFEVLMYGQLDAFFGMDKVMQWDFIWNDLDDDEVLFGNQRTKIFTLENDDKAKLMGMNTIGGRRFAQRVIYSKNHCMNLIIIDPNSEKEYLYINKYIDEIKENGKKPICIVCVAEGGSKESLDIIYKDAKKSDIPVLSYEDFINNKLLTLLCDHANKLVRKNDPLIRKVFWDTPFKLNEITPTRLNQAFESASVKYIQQDFSVCAESALSDQINNRIPKNLTEYNCVNEWDCFLKSEGPTSTTSFKYLVMEELLGNNQLVKTDEEADRKINDMLSVVRTFKLMEEKAYKIHYFRFFAKEVNIPEDISNNISQHFLNVNPDIAITR